MASTRITTPNHKSAPASARSRAWGRWMLHPLVAALSTALPLQALAQAKPLPTALPVPVNSLAGWRVSGQGQAGLPVGVNNNLGGRDMRIEQSSQRAIYKWQSFNIGETSSVTFDMAQPGASALNRVGGTAPSQIFGKLKATNGGELLIYNPNGILFGAKSSVDVGSLLATTLSPKNADYLNGFVGNITGGSAAFRYDSADGAPYVANSSFVHVEPGAELKTAEGGRIFLFAKQVINEGKLTAPGGQVVLAGGAEVYYKQPKDEAIYASEVNTNVPALRGLLVEVGKAGMATGAGEAINKAGGVINTPRGNTTLVGLAVNQSGRISASTSVSQNGSIMLLAQGDALDAAADGISTGDPRYKRASTSGKLLIGAGSRTEILADGQGADGKPLLADDNATFVRSRLDLAGANISIGQAAEIVAPGALAQLQALKTPNYVAGLVDSQRLNMSDQSGRIVIDAAARIDVSGTRDTELSVARNFVTTELLGSNDLKDAPLQKEGLLYRNKVTLDIRQSSPILGDLESYRKGVQRGASERLASGGSLRLLAGEGVYSHATSTLSVAGGQVNFVGAEVRPTQLFGSNGQAYTLNNAPKDLLYTGISNAGVNKAKYDRWGAVVAFDSVSSAQLEAGYVEGRAGGNLTIIAPRVTLDGGLVGGTVLGRRQAAGLDALAAAGQLRLGALKHVSDFGDGSYDGAILERFALGASAARLSESQWADLRVDLQAPLSAQSGLSASRLMASGFGDVVVAAQQDVGLSEDLTLASGAKLSLLSEQGLVRAAANVRAPAGALTLRSLSGAVEVAPTIKLDVSGLWVNAAQDSQAPLQGLAGGSLTLQSGGSVKLGQGAVLDVSGGALMTGTLKLGDCAADRICGAAAGAIVLSSGVASFTEDAAARGLDLSNAALRGYSMTQGGSLSLVAASVQLTDGVGSKPDANLQLGSEFFSQGGFQNYTLDGRSFLTIAGGFQLKPQLQLWQASPAARVAASTADSTKVQALMQAGSQTTGFAKPVNISLASSGLGVARPEGQLNMATGSAISLAPTAKLNLAAGTSLMVDGSLTATGGQVNLRLSRNTNVQDVNTPRYLWLGGNSRIDVAGQRQMQPSNDGLLQGRVLPGGSVNLEVAGSLASSLVWQSGGKIDISGAVGELDLKQRVAGSEQLTRQTVASGAGSLTVRANQDLLLEGDLRAFAGAKDQAGGKVSVRLELGTLTGNTDQLPPLRELRVGQQQTQISANLSPEQLKGATELKGRALLSAAALQASGADELSLSARERIAVDGGVSLNLARAISLDAPVVAMSGDTAASLSAADLVWANTQAIVEATAGKRPLPQASTGASKLTLQASERLLLDGELVTQGLGNLSLLSGGDLLLQSHSYKQGLLFGSLTTLADVRLNAAQIFPATDTQFQLSASGHSIEFGLQGTTTPAAPWSAGGSLLAQADMIVQGGRLRAPAGRIELQGAKSVGLLSGSETSVSAAGQDLLFGNWSGEKWFAPGAESAVLTASAAPAKSLVLSSAQGKVRVDAGAKLDLSGGGSLQAWQFVPGPGGSTDVFSGSDGAFAIVPAVASGGHADVKLTEASTAPSSGRQITIGTGGPVPAGTYTLLPARYALLDGAFLLRPAAAGTPLALGTALKRDDGTVLVGAKLGVAGTQVLDAQSSTWQVLTPAQARKASEIRMAEADSFFSALAAKQDRVTPALSRDAGSLVVTAQRVDLQGAMRFDAAKNKAGLQGSGGAAFFAADRIQVGGTPSAQDVDMLWLSPAQLSDLGVQSLVLGAAPASLSEPLKLNVRSSTVNISSDATQPLRTQSLLLLAKDSLSLGQGATISAFVPEGATSSNSSAGQDWRVAGDGAAILLSGNASTGMTRSEAKREIGSLSIADGVSLTASSGSLLLDATFSSSFGSGVNLAASHIGIGAPRIQIGGTAAVVSDSLLLDGALLTKVSRADQLMLRSYSSIDLLAGASLGSASLGQLSLDTPLLQVLGDPNAGAGRVQAAGLVLGNSTGLLAPTPVETAQGKLLLTAGESVVASKDRGNVMLAAGEQRWHVAQAEVSAERALLLSGKSRLNVDGDLLVRTPVLKASALADADWQVRGAASLLAHPAQPSVSLSAADAVVASRLAIKAASLGLNTLIDLPAGQLSLQATGQDADVVFDSSARVNVAGRSVAIGTAPNAPVAQVAAGSLTARSEHGDIEMRAGALFDLSGSGRAFGAEGGDAGRLELSASEGGLTLRGELSAAAGSAERGGSLSLDSSVALDLADLSQALKQAGNYAFAESIAVRNRVGAQILPTAASFSAQRIALTTDGGALTVAGSLSNASAAEAGYIALNARDDITVLAGAKLSAKGGEGGTVSLNSQQGWLNLQAGASIDVSNAAGQTGSGELLLRAARQGQDVRVSAIQSSLTGVSRVDVEAFKVYDGVKQLYDGVAPTAAPTLAPTLVPTAGPTKAPTAGPTLAPTSGPTKEPTTPPTVPSDGNGATTGNEKPPVSPTPAPGLSAQPSDAGVPGSGDQPSSGTPGTTKDTKPPPAPTGPTVAPTASPTAAPTVAPTTAPTVAPTAAPTVAPTASPTVTPTVAPTVAPTVQPTAAPTTSPTVAPTVSPTVAPTIAPTVAPTAAPSSPSAGNGGTTGTVKPPAPPTGPSTLPTLAPTSAPTDPSAGNGGTTGNVKPPAPPTQPSVAPTGGPTVAPTATPTVAPTSTPTVGPTVAPTVVPTVTPTVSPTVAPTIAPTVAPTVAPTLSPTVAPTVQPTVQPTTPPADPAMLALSQVVADNRAFMGTDAGSAETIAARISNGNTDLKRILLVRPGVEIRAAEDLKLQDNWAMPVLSKAQIQQAPHAGEAAITLRAAGDLLLQADLSTGLRPSPIEGQGLIGTSERAGSIRLVAGADLSSADPMAIQALDSQAQAKGSLLIGQTSGAAVKLRSTVGRISLAAARDIQLLNPGATVLSLGAPVGVLDVVVEPTDPTSPELPPSDAGAEGLAAAGSLLRAQAAANAVILAEGDATEPSTGNGNSTGNVKPPAPPTVPGQTAEPTTTPTPGPTQSPTVAPTPSPTTPPVVIDPLPVTTHQFILEGISQDLGSSGVSPFTQGGRGITLQAGRDIKGAAPVESQRYVSDWLWRARSSDVNRAWFARADKFQQGFATLGGGNIRAEAGRDVSQLRVAAASSGYAGLSADAAAAMKAAGATAINQQFGGGSVSVLAGRDVISGQFMAARQGLDLKAGGVVRSDTALSTNLDPGLQLIYQDGQVRVQTGGNATVASVRNFAYAYINPDNNLGRDLSLPALDFNASLFLQSAGGSINYLGADQVRATGVRGNEVSYVLPADLRILAPKGLVNMGTSLQWSAAADPGKARTVLAAEQDLDLGRFEVLALAAQPGQAAIAGSDMLSLALGLQEARTFIRDTNRLATLDQSNRVPVQLVSGGGDVRVDSVLVSARPLELTAGRDVRFAQSGQVSIQHHPAAEGMAQESSVIKAGRDLAFSSSNSTAGINIAGPGELLVLAGRDIDLGGGAGIVANGNLANSVLLPAQGSNVTVVAGLREDGADYRAATQQGFHVLGASGLAGKQGLAFKLLGGTEADFDRLSSPAQMDALRGLLGDARMDAALVSYVRGLPARPNVAEQRLRMANLLGKPVADAAVDAALKDVGSLVEPAWSNLSAAQALKFSVELSETQRAYAVNRILLAQLSALPASKRTALLQALGDPAQLKALASYVQINTGEALTIAPEQALARFEALPVERQMPWLNSVLMAELRSAGRAALQLEGDEKWSRYGSAYMAIDILLPQDRPKANIVMSSSQIKTMQKADITVINPGGGAVAGDLVAKSVKAGGKSATELGLVTVNGGDINTVVAGNFEVNSSRVFTLGKGNVLMWSSTGNIDAGRGAKTVSGAPAPVLRLDSEGRLVFDTSGSFSGSGIAVLSAGSDLDLHAPTGEINAGEAGIRSKGNAFLGAERLVNANDIKVDGARSGAAPEVVAAAPITLPASDAVTNAASGLNSAEKDDDEKKRRRSRRNLLLEFLGFGNS
ncbi:filamentous hemagglutinin family protein [Paucibacter sp. B2R-40]|uniref:filamentous haemagglutinin family protein n=1 Tax=Paucibacter sp. B2R-40 TaxID=2893554 RepID=UPI0021E4E6B3|nr:filamentous haemagglutinin family protein [Paucibacter sp. B2R-40]MCV2354909.1 filamentous hemagglutinin family protein [Paucibacter sp. B2R-40]